MRHCRVLGHDRRRGFNPEMSLGLWMIITDLAEMGAG
jgi:hypothetical protein